MKIVTTYAKEEMDSMKELSKAIAPFFGVSDEKAFENMEQSIRMVSDYCVVESYTNEDGSFTVEVDTDPAFAIKLNQIIMENTDKIAAVMVAMASVVNAIKALVPAVDDIKVLFEKVTCFHLEEK